MEALFLTQKVVDGKLVIEVPEMLNGKELEIMVTEKATPVRKFHEMPVAERIALLEQFKGSAKYPDTEVNKYDVYEQ